MFILLWHYVGKYLQIPGTCNLPLGHVLHICPSKNLIIFSYSILKILLYTCHDKLVRNSIPSKSFYIYLAQLVAQILEDPGRHEATKQTIGQWNSPHRIDRKNIDFKTSISVAILSIVNRDLVRLIFLFPIIQNVLWKVLRLFRLRQKNSNIRITGDAFCLSTIAKPFVCVIKWII